MSSAASISAAKKRRANQVQPPTPQQQQQQQQQQQRPMTAPSLASLTPAQRQQFLMQQQQRMQQMQQMQQQQQPQPQPQQQQMQQQKSSQQKQGQGQGQGQPNKKPGLTWPAPPIYLMKQMDTMLFQQSQSIDDIKNRLNCIESGSLPGTHSPSDGMSLSLSLEQIKPELMSDEEFVSGIVDNIMTNSNLSDIIEQIDAVQIENKELRDLLYAQQKTINEMNLMLLKLFSQNISAPISVPSNGSNSSAQSPAQDQYEQDQDQDQDQEDQDQDQDQDQGDNIQLDVSNMQAVD